MLSEKELSNLRTEHGELFTRKALLHPASPQGVVVRKVTIETVEPAAVHDTAIEVASGDLCIQLDRLHYLGSLRFTLQKGKQRASTILTHEEVTLLVAGLMGALEAADRLQDEPKTTVAK